MPENYTDKTVNIKVIGVGGAGNNVVDRMISGGIGGAEFVVVNFPYFDSKGISAVGSYLNFLETEKHIFLPVFGDALDETALKCAREIFNKKIIPVNINGIAEEGGGLNCISWEKN